MSVPTIRTADGVVIRLPHRDHIAPKPNGTLTDCREYAIEHLVAHYGDTDEEWAVDLLRMLIRPDLTHAELFEHLEHLCRLSEWVAEFEGVIGRDAEWHAACDDYTGFLTKFATPKADPDAETLAGTASHLRIIR
jgi:hypothetical protein